MPPITYEIDIKNAIVVTTMKGKITNEDSQTTLESIRQNSKFQAHFNHIIDMRQITENKVTVLHIHQVSKCTPFSEESKRAFVVKRNLERRNVSMYIHWVSQKSDNFYISESLVEAHNWIFSKNLEKLQRSNS